MKRMNPPWARLSLTALAAIALTACSGSKSDSDSSSSTAPDANKPSTVASYLETKIEAVADSIGDGFSGSRRMMKPRGENSAMNADQACSEHGTPVALNASHDPVTTQLECYGPDELAGGGDDLGDWDTSDTAYCRMYDNADDYIGRQFYCAIGKNTGSPDSLQGALGIFGDVSCAAEKAGAVFQEGTGTPQTVTLTFSTACFEASLVDEMCASAASCTKSADVTAVKNPVGGYYDSSLRVEILSDGIEFNGKMKASGNVVEIAVGEPGSDATGEDAYSIKYNDSTKQFFYEGRFNRISCLEAGHCGWSRHYRIFVDLDETAGELIPTSIEGAISDIYRTYDDGLGSVSDVVELDTEVTGYYSQISTIRGSMAPGAAGLTGKRWTNSEDGLGVNSEASDRLKITDAASAENYAADPIFCYARGADPVAGACAGVAAVAFPASGVIGFLLPGAGHSESTNTADATKFMDNSDWFAALLGFSFTTVDLTVADL